MVVGWLVSMKYNFNQINAEMNDNVGQNFDQAEQEVLSLFGDVNDALRKETKNIEISIGQEEVIEEVEKKVETITEEVVSEKE